jgi:hypothetical protein
MIKKDKKLITLVILFVLLGFLATLLANELHFIATERDNPALLSE